MHPVTSLLPALVDVALDNVSREYPYHVVHLAHGDGDVRPPRELYPAFHGSYDWHSCVHMHWSLVRSLSLGVDGARRARVVAHLDRRLTTGALEGEIRYFEARGHAAFERPYGWAWLVLLAAELEALAPRVPEARAWRHAVAPLAALLARRFEAWLPRAEFPVRAGTHCNTAFALVLAAAYADVARDAALAGALGAAARRWYRVDTRYPAAFEPSGDDFLSGGLCEALAMARLLPRGEFEAFWRRFEPDAAGLACWTTPVGVSDPTDPKLVHLAGLNLSRAYCWRALAPLLPEGLAARASAAAEAHLARSLAAATSGDYVGTHWLASFALLALTGERPTSAPPRRG